jgi:4-hydroxy-4-methyl-2-oxoglutarate aldolase
LLILDYSKKYEVILMEEYRKDFSRPDKEWIEKFKDIPSPIIGDVMGRQNIMDARIQPRWEGARIIGPAFTVTTYPSDNLMIHVAVKYAEPDDVLIIDSGNYPNAGLWGEILTLNALKRNIGGVIIDGGARDIAEIAELKFPLFSSSVSARGGYKVNPGKINVSTACGGVSVNPGDLIIADENGVAVIPQKHIERVYNLCIEKLKSEKQTMEQLSNGENTFDLMGMDKVLEDAGIKII